MKIIILVRCRLRNKNKIELIETNTIIFFYSIGE